MKPLLCLQLCLLVILCGPSVNETSAGDSPAITKTTSKDVPTYVIYRAKSKITIDGRIDEDDWKQAKSVGDFVFEWWKKGMRKKEQTVCKMLWDDKYLYFAYVCEDAHVVAIHAERDGDVPLDDSVEVYITPNIKRPSPHYAFFTSPLGALYDIKIDRKGKQILKPNYGGKNTSRKASWDSQGVIVAATIDGTLNIHEDTDRFWTNEIAIPFKNFSDSGANIPPKPNDVWKLNPNRHGYTPNARTQYSQWAPTLLVGKSFFAPKLFGKVIFSGETVSSKR